MQNNNKKAFEAVISKTKIYLAIIAILLIVLCCQNIIFIIPSIIIYSVIIIYTFFINNKKRNELSRHIQELTINVDSAAKNTLINSPFPLVILETNGNVIWKSSKFANEFNNIDINNILENLSKEIKQELDNSKSKKTKTINKQILIGKKNYQILGEYVKNKSKERKKQTEYIMILYFIDDTEKIKALKKFEDSKTCIGIIKVDNYEEIMQRISSEEKPQVTARIEKIIYEWVAKSKGIVLKADRDTFVHIFEQKYLEKIKKNKFDILDETKEIDLNAAIQITLSISVSNDGTELTDKYQSAVSGMDIVLGRGGDQAVVRENGKYNFFGGRAQEVEKRTKVKARIVAHALEELMRRSREDYYNGSYKSRYRFYWFKYRYLYNSKKIRKRSIYC